MRQKSAKQRANLKAKVFFGIGSKETTAHGTTYPMVEDMKQFVDALNSEKTKGLQVDSVVFQDENHDTVFPVALTRGDRHLFG